MKPKFKILVSAVIVSIIGIGSHYYNLNTRVKNAEIEILYLQGQVRVLKKNINHILKHKGQIEANEAP